METLKKEKKYLATTGSTIDIEVKSSDGAVLRSANGRNYIDLFAGWCVGNLGWGRKEIEEAIRQFNGPAYVYPGMHYEPWQELAEILAGISPGNLAVSYRATGGSESVDTAMQIAMAYTGRKKFLSVEGSYHGNTIGPLSIGETATREKLQNALSSCLKIDKPLDENAIAKVETRLKKKDVAAFIMEPVLMNLGVHVPTIKFMYGLQKLCKKYGTLLIMDEVATGFGRTGKLFASEHFGIEPDILCLSKALSGGYAPIGATMTTEKIYRKVKDDVNIYSTYGWHPLSTAAAIANLNFYKDNKEELFAHIHAVSQQFRTAISQMTFKKGGKISMMGLAIAVDVEDDQYASSIEKKCRKNGVLVSRQAEKIILFPPLTIGEKTVTKAMGILSESI
jgi:adenosylmethionine-8-amino-7-oxononanoate aminotransferase